MAGAIDWNFIAAREGKEIKKGYVPENKKTHEVIGKSGVTVGTGFDIGQHDKSEIEHLAIPASLKKKLLRFTGKKKQDAITELDAYKKETGHDFELTNQEVKELDSAVRAQHVHTLAHNFDRAVAKAGESARFNNLPSGIQTAIASLSFQYGANLAKSKNSHAKKFWDLCVHQKWAEAADLLHNFDDPYRQRRHLEEGRLREGIEELKNDGSDTSMPGPSPSPRPARQSQPSPTPQYLV